MFSQEIINDLNKPNHGPKNYKIHVNRVINYIKTCHKFHIGDYDEIYKLFQGREGQILFVDDYEYLKLPYKVVYLDGMVNRDSVEEEEVNVPKRAMLVIEVNKEFWFCYIINKFENVDRWILSPIGYLIHLGLMLPLKDFYEILTLTNDFEEVICKNPSAYGDFKASTIPIPLDLSFMKQVDPIETMKDDQFDMVTLSNYITLLNCKNVGSNIIKVYQSAKKSNKGSYAGRKIELPQYSYHILKLKLPGEKNEKKYISSGEAMTHYRRHFCRGHFKTFTEEKPLLGKHIGRYWFSAHLRGNNDGIVDKDYTTEIIK